MKLSERREELLIWLADGPEIVAIADIWLCEVAPLEAENERLRKAANSLLGMIDCLGGRWSLDNAGPDRKNLAELVNYPDALGGE